MLLYIILGLYSWFAFYKDENFYEAYVAREAFVYTVIIAQIGALKLFGKDIFLQK